MVPGIPEGVGGWGGGQGPRKGSSGEFSNWQAKKREGSLIREVHDFLTQPPIDYIYTKQLCSEKWRWGANIY